MRRTVRGNGGRICLSQAPVDRKPSGTHTVAKWSMGYPTLETNDLAYTVLRITSLVKRLKRLIATKFIHECVLKCFRDALMEQVLREDTANVRPVRRSAGSDALDRFKADSLGHATNIAKTPGRTGALDRESLGGS